MAKRKRVEEIVDERSPAAVEPVNPARSIRELLEAIELERPGTVNENVWYSLAAWERFSDARVAVRAEVEKFVSEMEGHILQSADGFVENYGIMSTYGEGHGHSYVRQFALDIQNFIKATLLARIR